MRGLLLLPLLAALSGCGGFYSVRVPYRLPASPAAVSARPALGALYLVLVPPEGAADREPGLAGLLGRQGPDMDLPALAGAAAAAIRTPSVKVCAWNVERASASAGAFASRFSPTGLLEISLSRPSISSGKEERRVTVTEKGKSRQVKSKVWVYTAVVGADVRLLSWPDRRQLDSWSDSETVSEERVDDSRDPEDWYSGWEDRLFKELAGKVAARYSGRTVFRSRPLFAKNKDKLSEKALALARSGDWSGAAAIWRERAAAGGGWRDYLGLAVASELSGDLPAARGYYDRARAASGGGKAASSVRWEEIFGDIDYASSAPPERACDDSWFGVKTVLLPFSDETNSVDGPPLVRQLVYDRLREAGYDLVPLEAADEALRRRGYSDGGQLAAARPEEIAAWLGAGRLIYCDISDYGEVIAGVYNRRMIAGTARIWEKGAPEVSIRESVIKISTQKSLLGGLASQLARGLMERIGNKPLGLEAGLFARQLSSDLPAMSR
ncbi:MAG: DUF799 family lipoprotein [Elusimicrobia bacterium]|nr:DUF799 family lipoprotein [Elusimicrobiota bacterium]